jgi:pimeloyl-ACP methyl ester carboxylesterase
MMLATNGMELHYDTYGAGEALLWLHGGMGHGADWQYLFKSPPLGYLLVAPDLRGHGRSTGAGPTYSFKQSAVDVLALLDALQIDRVKIIGLSGGGISALHVATIQPDRVEMMVVVSAPAAFPERAKTIQRGYSLDAFGKTELEQMRRRHPRPGQLETLLAQVRAMPDGHDPEFTFEELGAIRAETLVVFGDRDPLYPVSLGFELSQAIPRSWLWVVPNGGHGPIFGASAPLLVETAMTFFSGGFRPSAA